MFLLGKGVSFPMKRILVCFKITDDFDELLPQDWLNLGTKAPDVSYVRRILGCFDEAALENTLYLRDLWQAQGEEVQLTALTLNPGYSDHIVKNLPALHFNRVVCLSCERDLRFLPEHTAELLAQFIRQDGPYDLVITGRQAPPANSGLVPFYLAEALRLHCLDNLRSAKPDRQGVTVLQETDAGVVERSARLPLLLSFGNAERSYLRIPTLRDKMATRSYQPEHVVLSCTSSASMVLLDLHRDTSERKCVFVTGETVEEKARAFYDTYLKEVLG